MTEPFIPLSVPVLRGREWDYIKECLDTNWVSSVGPFVDRFETEFAAYVGAEHAVAVVNGTAALHLALITAGVRAGDEVLVSDLTFIAPVNAIRYLGAHPVLVDAEPTAWQMDIGLVADFLKNHCSHGADGIVNQRTGRRVAAIVPAHILGQSVDMDPLLELAGAYGLTVVEDASEGLGARYKGRTLGTMGLLGCFSFNGNKLITTGGGGMVVTADADLAGRVRHLSTQAKADAIEYLHDEVGYNYRLTNVLAALGCAQLENLSPYIGEKLRIAAGYADALAGIPGITPMPAIPGVDGTYWLYTVLVDAARFGMDSRQLLRQLQEQGIQSRPLWQPLHLSQPHRDCQFLGGGVTDRLYADGLSLPCSVDLSPDDQARVVRAIARAAGQAA